MSVISCGSTGMMMPKPSMSISTTRNTKTSEDLVAGVESDGAMGFCPTRPAKIMGSNYRAIFIVSSHRFTYTIVND